jgi:hypothetical protein
MAEEKKDVPPNNTDVSRFYFSITAELAEHDISLTKLETVFLNHLARLGFFNEGEAYQLACKITNKTDIDISTARVQAHQLLRTDNIRKAVNILIESDEVAIKERIEYEMVQFWYNRAFWKPTDVFDADGSVKPLDKLSPQALSAVDGIKVDYRGKEADRRIIHYDMANRDSAMKSLIEWMKRTGGKEDHKDEGEVQSRIKSIVDQARDKESLEKKKLKAILERKTQQTTKVERITLEDDDDEDENEKIQRRKTSSRSRDEV